LSPGFSNAENSGVAEANCHYGRVGNEASSINTRSPSLMPQSRARWCSGLSRPVTGGRPVSWRVSGLSRRTTRVGSWSSRRMPSEVSASNVCGSLAGELREVHPDALAGGGVEKAVVPSASEGLVEHDPLTTDEVGSGRPCRRLAGPASTAATIGTRRRSGRSWPRPGRALRSRRPGPPRPDSPSPFCGCPRCVRASPPTRPGADPV
jgi:hypothetical protein